MKVIHACEILDKIKKNDELIEYRNVTIKDGLDFSALNIEITKQNEKEIIEIKSKFYFINCTFEGQVITCDEKRNIAIVFKENIHFASSMFLENVKFSKAIFENDVDFYNSSFKKALNCYKTFFKKNVTFEGVQFQGICNFFSSIFKGISHFNSTIFSGKVSFEKTKFTNDVYFINANFKFKSIFRKTCFLRYTSFEEAVFSDNINFSETVFKGKNIFNKISGDGSIKFDNIIYKIKNIFFFQMIRDYKGKIYFIDSNIKKCSFLYSEMNCFVFQNVKWNIKGNGIKLIDEVNLPDIPDEKIADTLYQIEIIYRQLKAIFLSIKDYKSSNLFHYAELRIKNITNKIIKERIKNIKKSNITKENIEIQISKYNKLINELNESKKKGIAWIKLFKLTSDYGMSWWRPWIWIFIILISFSFITVIETGGKYNSTLILLEYNKANMQYIEKTKNLFANDFLSQIIYSLFYHICNSFLVPQKNILSIGILTLVLSRIENILIATLLIMSGFAIKKQFQT